MLFPEEGELGVDTGEGDTAVSSRGDSHTGGKEVPFLNAAAARKTVGLLSLSSAVDSDLENALPLKASAADFSTDSGLLDSRATAFEPRLSFFERNNSSVRMASPRHSYA